MSGADCFRGHGLTDEGPRCQTGGVGRLSLPALCLLPLLASCQRGPQYCIFDGTIIGAAPQPFVAMNPDGTVDETRTRYTWREFVWPTDPAWTHVRREGAAWLFEGTTGGTPWTFRGVFSADAGSGFVRTDATGTPPPVQVVGSNGKPTLLVYRLRFSG